MNDKPKREKSSATPIIKFIVIITVATVIGCGACFAAFFGVLNALLAPVTEVADDFMSGLRDGDYQTSFDQLSFNLKTQVEDPQRLGSLVLEYGAEPDGWNFSSRSVENQYGELSGTVRLKNGERAQILVRLQVEDEIWRVTYFEWDSFSSEDL